MFSPKSTQYVSLKAYKKLYAASRLTSTVTDTDLQTHALAHKMTTRRVILAHALRLDNALAYRTQAHHLSLHVTSQVKTEGSLLWHRLCTIK